MSLIARTASAYDYPLLIKNILLAPLADNPELEIVYKDTTRMTYRQFRDRVARLASALLAMGVRKGDTVAVMDWDSHRYLECYFAVPMIGAVLHTINVRLPAEQLLYTMNHAEDRVVLIHADFTPLVLAFKDRLDSVKNFILMRDDAEPAAPGLTVSGEYEALLEAHEPLEEFPDFDENTRATTFYTTGTTGRPKGVYFSHRQLVLHTMTFTAALGSNPWQGSFHRGDVYMPITPMFHVHAWGVPYIATYLGVKQVYPGRYNPTALAKLVVEEQVTFSHCVPTVLSLILRDASTADADFSRWKVVIGGSALPKALAGEAFRRGIDIFAGYGLSESCPIVTISQITGDDLQKSESDQIDLRVRAGIPSGMVYLKVVDPEGNERPRDGKSAGEIVLRAPWLTQGYFKEGADSEKLWQGGWLHTQDIGVRTPDGALRITDRMKDVIKVSGEWVSSIELEDILCRHPAVAEAAVIAKPDPRWGEIPLAFVVLKPGQDVTGHTLVNHVKTYADTGVVPREVVLLKVNFTDRIEKTSVGKTDKVALKARLMAESV